MSRLNPDISKTDVIPVIESDLFANNMQARFAIGIVAVGDAVHADLHDEYDSYYQLRRNCYVEETGQLDQSEIDEDGTDRDTDDARSVAFAAFENLGVDEDHGVRRIRTVSALRLIMKGFGNDATEQRPLPVEEFCPDIFATTPAPVGSTEVSRFITRHESARMQDLLKWKTYGVGLAYVANHNLGPTYAVIEPWLERHFKGTIPVSRIGEPRYIPHYQDYNLPIEVHTDQLAGQIDADKPGSMRQLREDEGSMHYFGRLSLKNLIDLQELASQRKPLTMDAEVSTVDVA